MNPWWQSAVIYQIYIRSCADTDGGILLLASTALATARSTGAVSLPPGATAWWH